MSAAGPQRGQSASDRNPHPDTLFCEMDASRVWRISPFRYAFARRWDPHGDGEGISMFRGGDGGRIRQIRPPRRAPRQPARRASGAFLRFDARSRGDGTRTGMESPCSPTKSLRTCLPEPHFFCILNSITHPSEGHHDRSHRLHQLQPGLR